MRRAKKPPTPEQRALAGVVADALTLERRADVAEDLKTLLPVAIAEFLRVFVAYNVNDRLWVVKHDRVDDGHSTNWRDVQYEVQYCCFFCRESLVTLPQRQRLTTKLDARLNRHAEQCGMMFLAGLTTGAALEKRPQPKQTKADRQRKAREKKKALAQLEQARLAAEIEARPVQLRCITCGKGDQYSRGVCEPCFARSERYRRLGLTDA